MGQAKKRGTFEQRKVAAIAKGNTRSGWWQDHQGYTPAQRRTWLKSLLPKPLVKSAKDLVLVSNGLR